MTGTRKHNVVISGQRTYNLIRFKRNQVRKIQKQSDPAANTKKHQYKGETNKDIPNPSGDLFHGSSPNSGGVYLQGIKRMPTNLLSHPLDVVLAPEAATTCKLIELLTLTFRNTKQFCIPEAHHHPTFHSLPWI